MRSEIGTPGGRGERLRIVVCGLIAQYPLGGVTWDYLQYPMGLAAMGHDVVYLEDTGQWPYSPWEGGLAKDAGRNVAYLAAVMDAAGLAGRWAYRFPWEGRWFGMEDAAREAAIADADLIVNVSGTLRDPGGLERRGRLVWIDSDPVFTQVKIARGQEDFRRLVDLHDVRFTFGETLGPDVPGTGHRWLPTRQPVVLGAWAHDLPDRGRWTTVMNWSSYNVVEHAGRRYGQKDTEMRRFLDLPGQGTPPLEIALAMGHNGRAPVGLLRRHGWSIVDPATVVPDPDAYRRYVQTSRGEWSVAKHGYVAGRSGWFSCRSACYLAAGRPVVAQETGFSAVLPTGTGLLAFTTPDEAAAALATVEADYARHRTAARAIAVEHLAAERVLGSLIERAFAADAGGGA